MGRETLATASWLRQTAEVKALLESNEIILRGAIRAKIPRAEISAYLVDADSLRITSNSGELRLDMGNAEASKWAAILDKPLPALAEKLGITASRPAFVIGKVDDPVLQAALKRATALKIEGASILIAILVSTADLDAAIAIAQANPVAPIWCVYGKGKFATVKDADIRATMRANGFIDTKSCGVSERLTATRYSIVRT